MTKGEFESLFGDSILEAILSSSYDGYSYSDEEGNILYCNKAYYQITGLPEGSIAGHSVFELVNQGYPVSAMTIQVMKTRRMLTEVIRYSPYSEHEVLVTMVPVYSSKTEKFIGTVANYRDLTGLNDMRTSLDLIELRYQREIQRAEETNLRLRHKIQELEIDTDLLQIAGQSKAMRDLFELARRISNVDSTVLITGESGVGKDVFCRMIQYFGDRDFECIKISCGAIPDNLLESELFGYESGAFTGAGKSGKPGIFEMAGDGIVFLDEIGEMPLQLQVKLLNVLQDRKFFRIGGTKEIAMNARVVAASNRDLKQMVAEGSFRGDLFYRLNVIPVYIPPLRERREDILPIAEQTLRRLNEKNHTNKVFSVDVQNLMKKYDWPGNIRELNNLTERMYVMCNGDIINMQVVPEELSIVGGATLLDVARTKTGAPLKETVAAVEAAIIQQSLQQDKPLTEIAEELGIGIATLERKVKQYGLVGRYGKIRKDE